MWQASLRMWLSVSFLQSLPGAKRARAGAAAPALCVMNKGGETNSDLQRKPGLQRAAAQCMLGGHAASWALSRTCGQRQEGHCLFNHGAQGRRGRKGRKGEGHQPSPVGPEEGREQAPPGWPACRPWVRPRQLYNKGTTSKAVPDPSDARPSHGDRLGPGGRPAPGHYYGALKDKEQRAKD